MCLTPVFPKSGAPHHPCGHCAHCLARAQRDRSIRLMNHAKEYKKNPLFLTLTYSDDNLTYGASHPTLVKRDVQLFLKRLRSKFSGIKISYFFVGEYGTKTKRPHYHAILYGLSKRDHVAISNSWNMGFVYIGSLSERSVNYVAKYHVLRGIHPKGSAPCFPFM